MGNADLMITRASFMKNIKCYHILLADDHAMVRHCIRKVIEKNPVLKVAGEVGDGLELLEFLQKSVPQMVVLDISMPRLGGLEVLYQIKAKYPGIKVLILTMHKNREYLSQAMAAGAEGYLLKEEADETLLPAIATILGGGVFHSSF
jgi:two-component system response regulator NreC